MLPANSVYMFIFEHKEWKMWKFFKKNIDKFVFDKEKYELLKNYNDTKIFVWENYKAMVWNSQSKSFARKLLKNNIN